MSAEVKGCTEYLDALGVGWYWSGLCVWMDESAARYAGELMSIGAQWSMKRGAYYFRFGGTR